VSKRKTRAADTGPAHAGRSARRLSAQDWIKAARAAFIDGGIEAVKVDRLALSLGVTRGSFYWHFRSRAALLDALLRDWADSNTTPIVRAVEAAGDDGHARMLALIRTWIDETNFSPAYDSAVRDWARRSQRVAAAVRRIDARRIALLDSTFRRFGYPPDEALIRARVTYFHQVGYYALAIRETKRKRLALLPLYYRALTGMPMP
jgi:AcrR family transcriptional regulator